MAAVSDDFRTSTKVIDSLNSQSESGSLSYTIEIAISSPTCRWANWQEFNSPGTFSVRIVVFQEILNDICKLLLCLRTLRARKRLHMYHVCARTCLDCTPDSIPWNGGSTLSLYYKHLCTLKFYYWACENLRLAQQVLPAWHTSDPIHTRVHTQKCMRT